MAFIEISFNTKRPLILGRDGNVTQLNNFNNNEDFANYD